MKNTLFAMLCVALLMAGCGQKKTGEEQKLSELAKSESQDSGHGHGAGESRTHLTEKTELFVEFPQLVAGEKATFVSHFTYLSDFKPVTAGKVTVILTGGGLPDEAFSVGAPSVPGIFKPEVTATKAGKRVLAMEIVTPEFTVRHELGAVTVFASDKEADASKDEGHEEGGISFTKEQQWKVDFAVSTATIGTVRDAVSATGTLRPASDAEAFIHAPTSGHILSRGQSFPAVGQRVKKGQVIALLVPHLGADADFASLEMTVSKSRLQAQRAKRERERLEGLLADEAIAAKRVQEAKTEEDITRSELKAAEERLAHYRRGTDFSGAKNTIPLVAPIEGELAEVMAAPGTQLAEGAPVFRIVDAQRLWLQVHVPESDLGRLGAPSGASFRVQGMDREFVLDSKNSRLLAAGSVIDSHSRTVPYTFELQEHDPMLRVGMAVQAQVFGDTGRESLTIPTSSLQDENGVDTVYVQAEGETFERRIVTVGTRAGGMAEIRSGLEAGERVVSRGAYLVRLASTQTDAGGGHAGHMH